MTGWVRRVHTIVREAAAPLSRRLKPGSYRVSFSVDEKGRGSNYAAGTGGPDAGRLEAAQSSMITAALASRSFPAPPDGASHAVSFVLRNGSPTGKPPADKDGGGRDAKP